MALGGAREQQVAHVLRRVTFGPHPGQVDYWASPQRGPQALIENLLEREPLSILPAQERRFDGGGDDWSSTMSGWFTNLTKPTAGLHEKMTWFWHGYLTSSQFKSEPLLIYRQHKLIRKRALGNFRTLLREITIDGAMLQWLDGDRSVASAPNENYSRELMELFTLGPGNYTEADVRAGAKALAGWQVAFRSYNVQFSAPDAHKGPLRFLGRAGLLDYEDVVDAVCQHPKCAPFVTSRIYQYFMGVPPSPARSDELSTLFRASNLEILPVVTEILTHPEFLESRLTRPKEPVEWVVAASAALGLDTTVWVLDRLGQLPFAPPNPAGWPKGEIMLSSQQMLHRINVLSEWWVDATKFISGSNQVDAVLERCSIHEVSDNTLATLRTAAAQAPNWQRPISLLRLALSSPEFQLA